MKRLAKAGSEHRKYLRQIIVSFDLTAPLYLYKELDTYKVKTIANSTSTMHKLANTPITLDCFEIDDFDIKYSRTFVTDYLIPYLEEMAHLYKLPFLFYFFYIFGMYLSCKILAYQVVLGI